MDRYLMTVTATVRTSKINEKIIDSSQISALNGSMHEIVRYIYFYSTDNAYNVCASCMIGLRDVHSVMPSPVHSRTPSEV